MKRRTLGLLTLAVVLLVAAGARLWRPFPKETTPEGAYMRIAKHMTQSQYVELFPYLETEAQWACYTAYNARKEALSIVNADFPEKDRSAISSDVADFASVKSGEEAFVYYAYKHGWLSRIRKDLSGIHSVEVQGERASVSTQRGTRYPFRRRENGIWGLTIFTAELIAESTRATRDLGLIKKSAEDYRSAHRPHHPE